MSIERLVEEKVDFWSELETYLIESYTEPIVDIWSELENHLLEDKQVKPPILKPREDNLEA